MEKLTPEFLRMSENKSSDGKRLGIFKCPYCGKEFETLPRSVKRGATRSCRCVRLGGRRSHGDTGKRLYNIYRGIKYRCDCPTCPRYDFYMGRGVSNEFTSYENFRDWALNNGYEENLTIDRIDNNKGYSPNNCRWTTQKEQSRNTRRSVFLTYKGETKTVAEWLEVLNLPRSMVSLRLRRGWSVEDAFEKPQGFRMPKK